MAVQDVKALEEVYARWERGDWSPAAIFADDTVFTTFDADGDEVVRHGVEEMAEWLRTFLEQWRDFRKAMVRVEQVDNRVLVVCRQSAAGKLSGVPLDMSAYDVWTFEGGRVSALYVTRHEDAAREKLHAR